MSVVILKLVVLVVIAVAAIAQWKIDNKWTDRRTKARHLWSRILLGSILVGTMVNALATMLTHEQVRDERAKLEADIGQREERARKERTEISQRITELVQLAREVDPNLTEQAALKRLISEIRALRDKTSDLSRDLIGFRQFSNVAELNAYGQGKLRGGDGVIITTALSKVLEGAYIKHDNGKVTPRCTDDGISTFKEAIEINPNFPFSYWALARCGYEKKDDDWIRYGRKAVEILGHTTRIAGHDKGHEDALTGIKRLFAGESARQGDYEGALAKLRPLAEAGDLESQYLLVQMHEWGLGTSKSDAAARRWYQRAAEGGHKKGQAALYRLGTSKRQ